MHVDVVANTLTSIEAVQSVASEWQHLHDSAGDTNPFSGPDWAITWLEHFTGSNGNAPHVVTVRDGERLIGVAPLYRQKILRGAGTIIQPIGTGEPWIGPYELPTLTAAAGLGRDVARAVIDHLCRSSDRWDWANIMFGATAPWFEPEWLPDWKHTITTRGSRAAVVLPLDRDGNIYAGRRNLKESFRRARNRLTRDFGADGWSARRVTADADLPAAFDRLAHLHTQRAYLDNGQPVHADVLHDPLVRGFLRDVVTRMASRGQISVYELLVGDEVLASQMILHTTTGSYSSISGAAERIWPYSAVTYLQSLAVRDAQTAGHTQFCLSIGPNQAKLRWTNRVDTYTEFALIGPRPRSQTLYLAAQTRDTIQAYRSARGAHRTSKAGG